MLKKQYKYLFCIIALIIFFLPAWVNAVTPQVAAGNHNTVGIKTDGTKTDGTVVAGGPTSTTSTVSSSVSGTRQPGEKWWDSVTGMEFVWVPKGCFQMGQTTAEKKYLIETYDKSFNDEFPRHKVCVDGFWMGKHEVTRGIFRQFVNATEYQTDAEKQGVARIFNQKTNWTWKVEKGYHWQKAGYPQRTVIQWSMFLGTMPRLLFNG